MIRESKAIKFKVFFTEKGKIFTRLKEKDRGYGRKDEMFSSSPKKKKKKKKQKKKKKDDTRIKITAFFTDWNKMFTYVSRSKEIKDRNK